MGVRDVTMVATAKKFATVIVTTMMICACSQGHGALANKGPNRPSGPTTLPGAPPLSQADADRLAAGATSADPAVRAGVLAVEVPSSAAAQPILPPGSTLSIDRATFRLTPTGAATVIGSVEGPSPGRWTLVLVMEQGGWRIVDTEAAK